MRTRRATAWGWTALFLVILLAVVAAFWLGAPPWLMGMLAVVVAFGVGSRLHLR